MQSVRLQDVPLPTTAPGSWRTLSLREPLGFSTLAVIL